jgi:peptide chain release factor 2
LAGGFDIAAKEKRIAELTAEMALPDFWKNREAADAKIRELGVLTDKFAKYKEIETGLEELERTFDENKFHEVKRALREFELSELFTGRYDAQAAVLSVFPGAGGEDAEDWARMLGLMYEGYAKRRGWKIRVIDDNIRSRTIEIKGDHAFGYLKNESGVHRLVRISPFSPKKLRHTSFALVEVIPDLPPLEESKLMIPESDLKLELSRAGGPRSDRNRREFSRTAIAAAKPRICNETSQGKTFSADGKRKSCRSHCVAHKSETRVGESNPFIRFESLSARKGSPN